MQNKRIEINVDFGSDTKEQTSTTSKRIMGAAMFGLGSAAVLAAINPLMFGTDATVTQVVACGVVSSIYNFISNSLEEKQASKPKRRM